MQLVINRADQSDEPRQALSRYVRGIADACTDPQLASQLNELARHYEKRLNEAAGQARQHVLPATDPASLSADRHFALA